MKTKTRSMEKFFIILLAALILSLPAILLYSFYGYRYSRSFILGKTKSQIADRFGTFDFEKEHEAGYEVDERNLCYKWKNYLGYDSIDFFYIYFDENGTANNVSLGCDPDHP